MNFLCHLGNHTPLGRRSLEDVIGIFGKQLRELGHTIFWDPKNDDAGPGMNFVVGPDAYNIIVEGFTPSIVEAIGKIREGTGAKFLCLATEEPTPLGFNHGTSREMVWRQEIFPEAMKHFEGILHLVPGKPVTDWFSQYAPTAYVELGHARSLERFGDPNREPKYEFGFYGSLTARRLNLLRKLANRAGVKDAVKVNADFNTQEERDEAMRDCKVVLQIRKYDEMGLISSSRCNTSLCCGRPVVAEPHDMSLTEAWSKIVKIADTDEEFFSMALLTAKNWRGAHVGQFRRFKETLTPEFCVGSALHKLGLTSDERGLARAA